MFFHPLRAALHMVCDECAHGFKYVPRRQPRETVRLKPDDEGTYRRIEPFLPRVTI
jgi:hypothetical protein